MAHIPTSSIVASNVEKIARQDIPGTEENRVSTLLSKNVNETVVLLRSTLETAGSFLLEWIPNVLTLLFLNISHAENVEDQSAGFGLAITWVNCFAIGILYGLSCGLETLASQAYGANKFKLVGTLYQRSLAILCAFMVPIFLLMFFSTYILQAINSKNKQMCEYAGDFCRYYIPGIFFNGIYNCTKCYLNAQNEYRLQVYVSAITTCLHSLWAYLIIYLGNTGIIGCALTKGLSDALNMILLFIFMIYTNRDKKVRVKPSKEMLNDWAHYLSVSVPIGALISLVWISYEGFTIMASFLDNVDMDAQAIFNNTAAVTYQFPYGCAIALTTFVGNDMGAYKFKQAQKFTLISVGIVTVYQTILFLPFWFLQVQWAHLFTSNDIVVSRIKHAFAFYLWTQISGGYQAVLTGTLRGIGKEKFSTWSMLICYIVVGQLTAYFLTFHTDTWKLRGIWFGNFIGQTIYVCTQVLCMVLADWNQLSKQIIEGLKKHKVQQSESIKQSQNNEKDLKQQLIKREDNENLLSVNDQVNAEVKGQNYNTEDQTK